MQPNSFPPFLSALLTLWLANNPSEALHSLPHAPTIRLFRQALASQGIDLNACEDMSDRLNSRHALWTERSINPDIGLFEAPGASSSLRGFHSINLCTRLIPCGPWHEDENQRVFGALAGLLCANTSVALLPLLLVMGIEKDEAQAAVDAVLEDLRNNRKWYLKCHRWSARKP
jgi:hypothetical protein